MGSYSPGTGTLPVLVSSLLSSESLSCCMFWDLVIFKEFGDWGLAELRYPLLEGPALGGLRLLDVWRASFGCSLCHKFIKLIYKNGFQCVKKVFTRSFFTKTSGCSSSESVLIGSFLTPFLEKLKDCSSSSLVGLGTSCAFLTGIASSKLKFSSCK